MILDNLKIYMKKNFVKGKYYIKYNRKKILRDKNVSKCVIKKYKYFQIFCINDEYFTKKFQ